ncbi:hypothetical protein OROGR_015567 [Orobanche gracilis]
MEPQNNLRFLFISLCLVVSIAAARSRLAPGPSPNTSPSPSPIPYASSSISEAPSDPSIPPTASESYADQPARYEDLPTSIISAVGVDFSRSLHSVGPNPIVSKICDNTDHPPLCLATILPFIKAAKGKTSVESVLRFAVQAGSEYAKEALSVAKNLISRHDASPELRSTLKDCKNSYDTAVENFAKTIDAFATKDIGTMRSVLSAVITFVGDCEDEFAEMQTQSPLSGYAEKLTDMTSNCLAIVSQMN